MFLKTLRKKRLRHMCFPVYFTKFLRTPFLQNTSRRLLLYIEFKTFVLLNHVVLDNINPFVPSTHFLYPLKTSKTVKFSDVFTGQRKGLLGTNGLNKKYIFTSILRCVFASFSSVKITEIEKKFIFLEICSYFSIVSVLF